MISVIVPVYNSENLLTICLNSILNQSYTNLEIILINDGSIDSSGIICDTFSKKDKRIKVVHKTNGGVASARNYGLYLAQGEYIAFIDNDDYIHPRYFEFLLKAIEVSNAEMAMTYYDKTFIFKNNIIDNPRFSFFSISPKNCISKIFESDNSHIPYVFIWAKLYKKELLGNVFVKDIFGEDIDFSYQIYRNLTKAVVIPHIMYNWYQHPSSQHRNRKSSELYKYIECYTGIFHQIPKKNIEIRGKCLKKLYITILSVRYNVKYYSMKKDSIKDLHLKVKKTALKYFKEFLQNKFISSFFKMLILIFYYFPVTYKIFRWLKDNK